MSPKATFFDFHGCGSFHRLSPSERFFLFACFSFFVKIFGRFPKNVAPGSPMDDDPGLARLPAWLVLRFSV
jgi:hypothetical protein